MLNGQDKESLARAYYSLRSAMRLLAEPEMTEGERLEFMADRVASALNGLSKINYIGRLNND